MERAPARVLVLAPEEERLPDALRGRGFAVAARAGPLRFGRRADDAVARAREELRGLDALVTVPPPVLLEPLDAITPAEWKERFRVWAEEPFALAQAWLRDVLARGGPGRWVAVTSNLGTQPFPSGGAVGAAAAALHTLVKIAAVEYGARGIRANAVAVGWREDAPLDGDGHALATRDTPARRLAADDDIAATVAWLVTGAPDHITGEILRVDGGYTITRGSEAVPYDAAAEWLLDEEWR